MKKRKNLEEEQMREGLYYCIIVGIIVILIIFILVVDEYYSQRQGIIFDITIIVGFSIVGAITLFALTYYAILSREIN